MYDYDSYRNAILLSEFLKRIQTKRGGIIRRSTDKKCRIEKKKNLKNNNKRQQYF